ncbi:MAG: S41 family peptidase [Pyrinomonadaceae bacterium]
MKFILTFAFLALSAFQAYAQTAAMISTPAADTREIRTMTFNKVWNTVNDNHFDPTFGGVDWKKVREIYEPKAMSALSDKDFHSVLSQMLGELKLSHFGILPPAAEIVAAQTGRGVVGIDLRMIDGVPVINRVDADSPADKSGLKPGFVISKIGGKPWGEITKSLETSLNARKVTEGMRKVYLERTLEAIINGKPETTLDLEVLNASDLIQKISLARIAFAGEMSQALGNFPPQEVIFESKMLPDNVGYIRFNMWTIAQMPKLRKAVREFSGTRSIVFDLRGNPGGVGGMAPGIAGLLSEKKSSLGSMKMRNGGMEFIVYPQDDPFMGQVIIVTDHGSGSTSEVFAAGMQEIGRAAIVGTTTAGAVLPSVFEKLPTGAMFQYAISDYRSPKNILIEGRGVIPDIEAKQTRKALLEGRDAQLDAAIKFILSKKP